MALTRASWRPVLFFYPQRSPFRPLRPGRCWVDRSNQSPATGNRASHAAAPGCAQRQCCACCGVIARFAFALTDPASATGSTGRQCAASHNFAPAIPRCATCCSLPPALHNQPGYSAKPGPTCRQPCTLAPSSALLHLQVLQAPAAVGNAPPALPARHTACSRSPCPNRFRCSSCLPFPLPPRKHLGMILRNRSARPFFHLFS